MVQQQRWQRLRQLLKLPFYMHLLPFFQVSLVTADQRRE
jgi:hypothetical protein